MKRILMLVGVVLIGMSTSNMVLADAPPGGGPAGGGYGQPQNLDTMKQRIEQRIQGIINKLQDKLSCVQAAQDPQSLRSCLPKRGQRRRGGNRMGRPGGQG